MFRYKPLCFKLPGCISDGCSRDKNYRKYFSQFLPTCVPLVIYLNISSDNMFQLFFQERAVVVIFITSHNNHFKLLSKWFYSPFNRNQVMRQRSRVPLVSSVDLGLICGRQNWLHGRSTCTVAQSTTLSRILCLVQCFAVTRLKFLIIF